MRTTLVLVALLAGCGAPATDGPGSDGASSTGASAPTTDGAAATPAAPAMVDVVNGTLEIAAPGAVGVLSFKVPDGYLELFARSTGDVRLLGHMRWVARAPDGAETVLLDGAFAHDDAGTSGPGLTCPCEWRLPATPGVWEWAYDLRGEMLLPLRVTAQ